MLIELVAGLTQPSLTTLSASHDDIRVKLDLHCGLASSLALRAPALAHLFELSLRLCQRGATPLAGAQVLGQLIATILPVELVLGRVDLASLLQNLPRERS